MRGNSIAFPCSGKGVWEAAWKLKPALGHKSASLIAMHCLSLEDISNPDNEDMHVLVDANSRPRSHLGFETFTTYQVSPKTGTDQSLFAGVTTTKRGRKQGRLGGAGSLSGAPQSILPRQPPIPSSLCPRQELSGVPQISNLEVF